MLPAVIDLPAIVVTSARYQWLLAADDAGISYAGQHARLNLSQAVQRIASAAALSMLAAAVVVRPCAAHAAACAPQAECLQDSSHVTHFGQ